MTSKIETHYTGGGITLIESPLNDYQYVVISSEAPDFLTVYSYSNGETTYLPDDMISSIYKDDLPFDLKVLHTNMLNKLKPA